VITTRRLRSERGDIILKQIIIALVIVVVVGFLLTEGGMIIWGRISTTQSAEDVADAVAFDYKIYQNEQQAREVAADKMRMMSFSDQEISESVVQFFPDGNVPKETVRVTVVKYINTIFTRHIGPLKKFSKVTVTKNANVATATGK
jgi:hypothetical protein